jgi:hypothetical protein
MSSRLAAEVRWFFVNYALLNALGFVVGVVWGAVLLAASPYGSIPGWTGLPIEQVFWYGVAVVFYVPLVFGIPLLCVALLAWRAAIRVAGHPRSSAYLVAAVNVLAAAILIPRTSPIVIALLVAAPLFTYATIVRRPPTVAG